MGAKSRPGQSSREVVTKNSCGKTLDKIRIYIMNNIHGLMLAKEISCDVTIIHGVY